MRIGVLLSGNGVYDGSEIHEAVLSLLAIKEYGAEAVCFAPDVNQHHVINHLNGEEMDESRNILVESARIARGQIKALSEVSTDDFDALLMPGGFGAAKNLTHWAFKGPDGAILAEVKQLIADTVKAGKPIGALCMSPVVIAKALEESDIETTLTVGTTEEDSPYDIGAISEGIGQTGAQAIMKSVREIAVDEKHKIVTGPCYMMEADILEVRNNIKQVVEKLAAF